MSDGTREISTRLRMILRRRLAYALEQLSVLQANNRHVFKSSELKDPVRTLPIDQGYLAPIIRGWVMASDVPP
jgi:hypothetical protein